MVTHSEFAEVDALCSPTFEECTVPVAWKLMLKNYERRKSLMKTLYGHKSEPRYTPPVYDPHPMRGVKAPQNVREANGQWYCYCTRAQSLDPSGCGKRWGRKRHPISEVKYRKRAGIQRLFLNRLEHYLVSHSSDAKLVAAILFVFRLVGPPLDRMSFLPMNPHYVFNQDDLRELAYPFRHSFARADSHRVNDLVYWDVPDDVVGRLIATPLEELPHKTTFDYDPELYSPVPASIINRFWHLPEDQEYNEELNSYINPSRWSFEPGAKNFDFMSNILVVDWSKFDKHMPSSFKAEIWSFRDFGITGSSFPHEFMGLLRALLSLCTSLALFSS